MRNLTQAVQTAVDIGMHILAQSEAKTPGAQIGTDHVFLERKRLLLFAHLLFSWPSW